MFIGASPGSTGGGVKTTTIFTLFRCVGSVATNKPCTAFRRRISDENILRAFVIVSLALGIICINTVLLCLLEPGYTFIQVLFEVVSGFGTVGLSTGITPDLHAVSYLILCLTMFFGRLGPMTMACIWRHPPTPGIRYAEESISIG